MSDEALFIKESSIPDKRLQGPKAAILKKKLFWIGSWSSPSKMTTIRIPGALRRRREERAAPAVISNAVSGCPHSDGIY
jgi:hypothetical protein